MRKSRLYVDPRQEKLWPEIDHSCDVGITWKEKEHEDFFGNVSLSWFKYNPSLLSRVPTISFRDLEEMVLRLPAHYGNHERRLERSLINPFTQMYGQSIRVPMAPLRINIENWERFLDPLDAVTNEEQEENNELG